MDYPSPLPIFRCDLALDRAAERFRPSQFEPGDLGSMSPMMLKIQKRIGHRSIRKSRVVSMPIIPSESNSSSDHSVESHYTPPGSPPRRQRVALLPTTSKASSTGSSKATSGSKEKELPELPPSANVGSNRLVSENLGAFKTFKKELQRQPLTLSALQAFESFMDECDFTKTPQPVHLDLAAPAHHRKGHVARSHVRPAHTRLATAAPAHASNNSRQPAATTRPPDHGASAGMLFGKQKKPAAAPAPAPGAKPIRKVVPPLPLGAPPTSGTRTPPQLGRGLPPATASSEPERSYTVKLMLSPAASPDHPRDHRHRLHLHPQELPEDNPGWTPLTQEPYAAPVVMPLLLLLLPEAERDPRLRVGLLNEPPAFDPDQPQDIYYPNAYLYPPLIQELYDVLLRGHFYDPLVRGLQTPLIMLYGTKLGYQPLLNLYINYYQYYQGYEDLYQELTYLPLFLQYQEQQRLGVPAAEQYEQNRQLRAAAAAAAREGHGRPIRTMVVEEEDGDSLFSDTNTITDVTLELDAALATVPAPRWTRDDACSAVEEELVVTSEALFYPPPNHPPPELSFNERYGVEIRPGFDAKLVATATPSDSDSYKKGFGNEVAVPEEATAPAPLEYLAEYQQATPVREVQRQPVYLFKPPVDDDDDEDDEPTPPLQPRYRNGAAAASAAAAAAAIAQATAAGRPHTGAPYIYPVDGNGNYIDLDRYPTGLKPRVAAYEQDQRKRDLLDPKRESVDDFLRRNNMDTLENILERYNRLVTPLVRSVSAPATPAAVRAQPPVVDDEDKASEYLNPLLRQPEAIRVRVPRQHPSQAELHYSPVLREVAVAKVRQQVRFDPNPPPVHYPQVHTDTELEYLDADTVGSRPEEQLYLSYYKLSAKQSAKKGLFSKFSRRSVSGPPADLEYARPYGQMKKHQGLSLSIVNTLKERLGTVAGEPQQTRVVINSIHHYPPPQAHHPQSMIAGNDTAPKGYSQYYSDAKLAAVPRDHVAGPSRPPPLPPKTLDPAPDKPMPPPPHEIDMALRHAAELDSDLGLFGPVRQPLQLNI